MGRREGEVRNACQNGMVPSDGKCRLYRRCALLSSVVRSIR